MQTRTIREELALLKSQPGSHSPRTFSLLATTLTAEAGSNGTNFVLSYFNGADAEPDLQGFKTYISQLQLPLSPHKTRFYLPLSVDKDHQSALILELDSSGKLDTLFFDPLGGEENGTAHNKAKCFIAALRETYPLGKNYRTTKEFVKDTNYTGEWSLFFLQWAAQTYAKLPLDKFPRMVDTQLAADLKQKPEDLRAHYLSLVEKHHAQLFAGAGKSEEEKEEENQSRSQWSLSQVFKIPEEGQNCPVYCVAQFFINELLKAEKDCAFKNRAVVIGKLTQQLNAYYGSSLQAKDLIPLIKKLVAQHPMVALNALSDALLGGFLKDKVKRYDRAGQEAAEGLLDDKVFELLGAEYGFKTEFYMNPPEFREGIELHPEGIQKGNAQAELSLIHNPLNDSNPALPTVLRIYYPGSALTKKHLHFNLMVNPEDNVLAATFNSALIGGDLTHNLPSKAEERLPVFKKLLGPVQAQPASSQPFVSISKKSSQQSLPSRTHTILSPGRQRAAKIFKVPLVEDEAFKSQYQFYNPQNAEQSEQILTHGHPAASSSLSLASPSSPSIPVSATEGQFRVGKHTFPKAVQFIKEFTVVESNKTATSLDSKIIFEEASRQVLKQKAKLSDLSEAERKNLLMVVDKQIRDGTEALQAGSNSVTITLHGSLSELMKETYKEYCFAMGHQLNDIDGTVLITGKEAKAETTRVQVAERRKYIEDSREELIELFQSEVLSPVV